MSSIATAPAQPAPHTDASSGSAGVRRRHGRTQHPLVVRRALEVEPSALSEAGVAQLERAADRDTAHRYVQSCLAVDFRTCEQDAFFGPQATRTADLPDPHDWARAMVAALLESMSGARAPQQFIRSMTSDLYDALTRRHTVARRRGMRGGPRSLVRRVSVCEPCDGVAEISVVVHHEGRVRALAMRMSGVDGRWLITALELG